MSYSKTVAFARWQYPYTLTPEQKAEKEEKDKNRKRYHQFPEGSNQELQKEFFRQLTEARQKFIVPEKTYCECDLSEPPAVLQPYSPQIIPSKGSSLAHNIASSPHPSR